MKIRAKANGNVLELADGDAEALLATGIYEPLGAPRTKVLAQPAAAPARRTAARKESTKVEPVTTQDVPQPVKAPRGR